MRSAVALYGLLASLIVAAPASASECPGNPGALGTSRTIVVDPTQHNLLGGFQYRESLPLNDKEVVITFDDGPLPPYTSRILDILARECVKATFFMVGKMASGFPKLVRRTHEEGHTLANHSQTHPFNFHTMSVVDAQREIEGAFNSIATAVGDPAKVAPFFRFPGLHRQDAVERYLASKQVMSWSVDFMADDWTRINSREIVRRALTRLEAKGKGILLLHDIQPATALGLPELLAELKARGYRVVHVVPSSAGLPATITTADQWLVRHPPTRQQLAHREPSVWPRVLPHRVRTSAATMAAPSVMSFGAETHEDVVPVSLVSAPDPLRNGDTVVAMPTVWPEEVITIAVLPEVDLLPAPAASNFRYNRIIRSRAARAKKEKRRPSREVTHSVNSDVTGSIPDRAKREPKAKARPGNAKAGTTAKSDPSSKSGPNSKSGTNTKSTTNSKAVPSHKSGKPRSADRPATIPAGHQIQITRPQANLTPAR
jgi:peptidoglycan/xylan/chitin deacetylase (PgdA/CDA1 family)